jgi:hypothetical protein
MIVRRDNGPKRADHFTHEQAWRDEFADASWPANPDAVYSLARERAREARQSSQMVRAILKFMDMPKGKVS